jgi:hypothetical protein
MQKIQYRKKLNTLKLEQYELTRQKNQ